MKQFLLILISFIVFTKILTAQSWTTLSDASGTQAYRHDDVYFTSADTGFTVLYNTSLSKGYIYKTTNGGASWNVVKESSGTHFRCITFLDSKIGFSGNLGKGAFDNATDTVPLFVTKDAGNTWTPINPAAGSNMKGLCAMFKVNDSTLYTAGRVRGPAFLMKTKNKGQTWETIDLTPFGLSAAMDLYFSHPDTGFVVGMNEKPYSSGVYAGKIIKTTDGGKTWITVLPGLDVLTYFWKITFPSKMIGYTSLQQNIPDYSTIIYYKTTDGGLNWKKNTIPVSLFGEPINFYTQGIHFINETKGWIGGGGGKVNFMETSDGGDSWTNITQDNTYRINKMRGFGDSVVYASGVRIHKFTYKKLTAGIEENRYSEFIAKLYPNPSSEYVVIEIGSKLLSDAILNIFDENGNFISERNINSSERISIRDLSKGLYFFKLSSKGKFWVSKVLVE